MRENDSFGDQFSVVRKKEKSEENSFRVQSPFPKRCLRKIKMPVDQDKLRNPIYKM